MKPKMDVTIGDLGWVFHGFPYLKWLFQASPGPPPFPGPLWAVKGGNHLLAEKLLKSASGLDPPSAV